MEEELLIDDNVEDVDDEMEDDDEDDGQDHPYAVLSKFPRVTAEVIVVSVSTNNN